MQEDKKKSIYAGTPNDMTSFAFKLIKFCSISDLIFTDLVVRTIMDPVSFAFHTSEGLQLNIVDIKILHILYFIFIFTPIFCEGKES